MHGLTPFFTEIIIWGGINGSPSKYYFLNTGGRYNPSMNSWLPTSTGANVPQGRYFPSGVWTGSELIVWGGASTQFYNNGARYNPLSDSWMPISTGTNVPSARRNHGAVWTGNEMIVWGGQKDPTLLNSGGRYNPQSDSWEVTSTGANCPSGREVFNNAIWTGNEMLIWGGGSSYLNDGGKYNPASNNWKITSSSGEIPSARFANTTSWTGNSMLVWGGLGSSGVLANGGIYLFESNISLSPDELPDGVIGSSYSQMITASGGRSPYSFVISSGTLPEGINLSSQGLISGSLNEEGQFIFTLTASDADGCLKSRQYSLSVTSVVPPAIFSVQKLGNPFRLKVLGSNFHPDIKVYIGGDSNPWTNIKYKSQSEIILKGGTALKNLFPKGVPVEIKVVNGDGGTATYTYTR